MQHNIIQLKLQEGEKSEDWYRSIEEHYIQSNNSIYPEEVYEKKKLYELFNNDISGYQEELNSLCNNLIDLGAAQDDLLPYNKLRNKYEILEGSLLQRANAFKIVMLSAKAVRNKNTKFVDAIRQSVEQDLAVVMNNALDKLEQMTDQELAEFIEEQRNFLTPKDLKFKNFLSDIEIYKNKMLKYIMQSQDITKKLRGVFKDVFIQDYGFIYNGWRHGKPVIEDVNPLFAIWHKSANVDDVSKGDYFGRREHVSLTHAMDELINKLSDKKLKEILSSATYYNTSISSSDHVNKYVFDHLRYYALKDIELGRRIGFNPAEVGTNQGNATSRLTGNHKIEKVHLEFKAYKEVIFYSYVDLFGEKITVILNSKADIIPAFATKVEYYNDYYEKKHKYVWDDNGRHEVEILWVPRRYESTRWSQDIRTEFREVPFQPDNVLNPVSGFTLSYKGGCVNSRNAKSSSLMQNGLPYLLQIYAAKALQNNEMAKYRGFELAQDLSQTPDLIGKNNTDHPLSELDSITRNEIIARKTGTRWTDSEKRQGGLPPRPTRPQGVSVLKIGDAGEMINLQNFINMLDAELGVAIGVPPAREGQMVPYSNVRDNERSVIQTSLQTEIYVSWVQELFGKGINECLLAYDKYFRKKFDKDPNLTEHLLEYITPDGTRDLIKILPEYLGHEDIGLFVDTGVNNTYREIMLQKIAQNTFDPSTVGLTSEILRAITSKNVSDEEINRMINVQMEKLNEREQAIRAEEQKLIQQQAQAERDNFKYKVDIETEASLIKEREKRITEIEKEKIGAKVFALQKDINDNKINDDFEKAKMQEEHADKRHEKDVKLKEKELLIKAKEKKSKE